MIVAKIFEQLGNQMLIYANAYALAKDNNEELALFKLECDVFKKKSTFRLNSLKIDKCYLYTHMPLSIYPCIYKRIINRLSNGKYFGNIMDFRDTKKTHYIIEGKYVYHDIKIDKSKKYNVVVGFWQSYKYFERYKSDIIRQFQPAYELNNKKKELIKDIENTNSVSIHIRRGDYVESGWCLNLDYYYNAINMINNKYNDCTFYIFSDDINWARENLKIDNSNVVYVPREDSIEPFCDIWAMSKCKHNIIANSTFSWWGAYLNQHDDKTVIVPNKIFTTNNPDFIPDSWIVIDSEM